MAEQMFLRGNRWVSKSQLIKNNKEKTSKPKAKEDKAK